MPHLSLLLPFLTFGALATSAHVASGGVDASDVEVEPQVDPVSAQISFVAKPKQPEEKPVRSGASKVTSRVDPVSGQIHFDISPQGTLMGRSLRTAMSKAVATKFAMFAVALIEIPTVRREIEHLLNKPIPATSEVVRRFLQRREQTQTSEKQSEASDLGHTQLGDVSVVEVDRAAQERVKEKQLQQQREAKEESEKVEDASRSHQERKFLGKRDKGVDAPVHGASHFWSIVRVLSLVGSLIVAACGMYSLRVQRLPRTRSVPKINMKVVQVVSPTFTPRMETPSTVANSGRHVGRQESMESVEDDPFYASERYNSERDCSGARPQTEDEQMPCLLAQAVAKAQKQVGERRRWNHDEDSVGSDGDGEEEEDDRYDEWEQEQVREPEQFMIGTQVNTPALSRAVSRKGTYNINWSAINAANDAAEENKACEFFSIGDDETPQVSRRPSRVGTWASAYPENLTLDSLPDWPSYAPSLAASRQPSKRAPSKRTSAVGFEMARSASKGSAMNGFELPSQREPMTAVDEHGEAHTTVLIGA